MEEYYTNKKEAMKRAKLIMKQGWNVSVKKEVRYVVKITNDDDI